MPANLADVRLTLSDGTDLTDKVNPRLIDLTLTEKRGEEADTLEVTIHNHDRAVSPPKKGAILNLSLGWKSGDDVTTGLVGKGRFKVDEVGRGGPPDRISMRARAADLDGEYRTRKDGIWKDTTLGAILTEIAGRHGLSPRIHPDLAGKPVAAIEQKAKSDMAFVRDLGRRYDAVAAPKGGALVFMPIGATTTAGGQPIAETALTREEGWAWEFTTASREDYGGAQASWRDVDAGRNRTVKVGDGKRKRLKKVYASEADARAAAQGEASKRKRGTFKFTYDLALGDPQLMPNCRVFLKGWDSEIDRIKWLVDEAVHKLSSGGLTTSLTLESA
jgi:phage protein D